jgi:hypothetical protein
LVSGISDGFQVTEDFKAWTTDYLQVGYIDDYGMPFYFTHMLFSNVNIPKGSTIDYVQLHYRVYEFAGNTSSFKWQFEDSDEPTSIYFAPMVAERDYVTHINYIETYSTTWSADTWRSFADFSAGLQDVIDRPGWSPGNHVGLARAPYAASGGSRKIYSYEGGSAPYLYVEYTEPVDDNYEENDTRATAYDLQHDEKIWLNTIDGYGIQLDDDWYRIYVSHGDKRVKITAQFSHSEGDINIALYNSSGGELIALTSGSDNEYIDFSVPADMAYYFIKVYYGNAGNQYDLWWDDSACYPLSREHTGSGSDPVTSPLKSPACSTNYDYVAGEYIMLTASPSSGYQVGSWNGTNNNSSTSTTNYVTMPDSHHTVTVNYITENNKIFIPILTNNTW